LTKNLFFTLSSSFLPSIKLKLTLKDYKFINCSIPESEMRRLLSRLSYDMKSSFVGMEVITVRDREERFSELNYA
jgi:hypothetical protein